MQDNVKQFKKKMNKALLQTANDAYQQDWSVVPADPVTKRPMIKWQKHQHYKADWPEINDWIMKHEGLALVTGEISGVIILDVDTKKGKDGFKALKDKHLPLTPTVKTKNGGYHYYFKYDKRIKSHTGIFEGVDIQSDSKIAILPGTPGYEWVDTLSIDDLPLAEPPDWLLNLKPKKRINTPLKSESGTPRKTPTLQGIEGGVSSNEYLLLDTPLKPARTLSNLSTENLRAWYQSEVVADRFLKAFEIQAEIGQGFKCILPGHEDNNPSASLYKGDNGVYVYRDWHVSNHQQVLLLPEVYASMFYKKVVTMDKIAGVTDSTIGGPELAVWGIRLLVDLGVLEPAKVQGVDHGEDLSPTQKKVYEGFIKLLACKWLYTPDEPTPYSWRFISAWTGVSYRKAGDALKHLLQHNYIKKESVETFKGREMSLYTVGDRS